MKPSAVSLCTLAAASALAACAAPSNPREEYPALDVAAVEAASPCGTPAFSADGRLRRDVLTEAPLFTAHAADVQARAPRFNDDGTVARDPETGAPVYEELRDGAVVRVLVVLP